MILYTVSIAVHNREDMTASCINHLLQCGPDPSEVEYIFADNASQDGSAQRILGSELPNLRMVRYGINRGFGAVHNDYLKLARGKYFIVLNNDIMVKEPGWLQKLTAPLENPGVALVGVEGNPASLRPDGGGYKGPQKEYVEGSIMAGSVELLRQYGLFSPGIKKFYFEDSECSLRYRQMGYRLEFVPVRHEHLRGATASTVVDPQKHAIIHRNNQIFLNRWSKYLQNRAFVNKVLVRMDSLGCGDIVAMTPIMEGLRADHPSATIEVDTSHPEVFLNNPHVDQVHGMNRRHRQAYDRVIDVKPDYKSTRLISAQAADLAATTVVSHKPQIYLTQDEAYEASRHIRHVVEDRIAVVVFAPLMKRVDWQGRNWNINHARDLVKMLQEQGVGIVEVGKDTESTGMADVDLVNQLSLREMFAVMAQPGVDFFIGIDSLCFHAAQAAECLCYVLFGATEPCARVVDFRNVVPIRKKELVCLGCYHKPGAAPINKCVLGTEVCMQGLDAEHVMSYLGQDLDCLNNNINYLQRLVRGEDAA